MIEKAAQPRVDPITQDQSDMGLPMKRALEIVLARGCSFIGAALVWLATMVFAFQVQAQTPTLPPPPGGPILLITDSSDPFGDYYQEILFNEGLNAFNVIDISSVSASDLNNHDVAILAQVTLNQAQVTMLDTWVNAGGQLIAMRPDPQLAALLGLSGGQSSLSEGYLLIDTSKAPGNGLVGETIQFHGTADLYTLNGAESLATLYSDASTPTPNPALTLRSVGANGGQAAAFTYDLARSIVYTRQGNPAWADQERDGFSPIRSDDKYFGGAVGDPQPDWIDLDKVAIPQADEQQRLLANMILMINRVNMPLPRFWYLPRGEKAVVLMTGDDHANNGTAGRFDQYLALSAPGCSVDDWECIRGTSYIYPDTPITDAAAAAYDAAGFEISLHLSTFCSDYTFSSLQDNYTNQLAAFATNFPSLPAPLTQRHHCIVWSDWVSGAKVQLLNGIRLDTSYYYWPPGWVQDRPGFFNGSGMPMRFADLDGSRIDVFLAESQMTDESGQTYPFTIDTLLDRALGAEGYYGVFTINAHTDINPLPESDAVVTSATARGVPIITARQLLTWLDGRNASSFDALSWSDDTLSFVISQDAGANGLQAMLPIQSADGVLTDLTLDGSPVGFTADVIKGVPYAVFEGNPGAYVATYGPDTVPPTVVSTTPTDGATDVSIGTTVTVVFSESMEPATITAGTIELYDDTNSLVVPATVSYDAGSQSATLTPVDLVEQATYTVTVESGAGGVKDLGGNSLTADFSASFTTSSAPCAQTACVIWPSSPTPANPSASDPNAVELGVKFRSDIDGYITGIRFYKGSANNGAHVGSLHTSGGQFLAQATFSNETASGWQQVDFATPVPITADTVYVASYHTDVGGYAFDGGYFAAAGVDAAPLHALRDGESGGNGLYAYSATPTFPTNSFGSTNYWVDVVFQTTVGAGTTPPTITSTTPSDGATDVGNGTVVTAVFSEAMYAATIGTSTFDLRDPTNALVTATVSYNAGNRTATLTPSAPLALLTTYTATIKGGPSGVKDSSGTALASDVIWSFTTAEADTTSPTVMSASPSNGAIAVSTGTVLSVVFSEAVDPATISPSTIVLRDPAGTPIVGTRVYDAPDQTVTLTPNTPLAPSATYTATIKGGSSGIKDLAGNALATDLVWSFTTGPGASASCPCSIWDLSATPAIPADPDTGATELGVKFRSDVDGEITGIRFYKASANTGTHVGSLWSSSGQLLAQATFGNETTSGWQQVNFATPVAINANTVYVVSYHAPNGSYSLNNNYFAATGVDSALLHALRDGESGGNGVYAYSATPAFPTDTYQGSNYWVDVVFVPASDATPPTVTSTSPTDGAVDVSISAPVTALFSEAMDAATITASTVELRDPASALVAATVTYDAGSRTATLTPNTPLASFTSYTATVIGGAAGVKDLTGNALTADETWSFTTGAGLCAGQPCVIWPSSPTPGTPSESDPSAVEVGVKFRSDIAGQITGIRFYKGSTNTGTHIGSLWSSSGQLLARATFSNETVFGWQQVDFASPVAIAANTVYVASYHTDVGNYAVDGGYFAAAGVDTPPLRALRDGESGGNGVYAYSATPAFPTNTFGSGNYWVDVVFSTSVAPDTTPPTVASTSPSEGATDVNTNTAVTAVFSEAMDPATITASTIELRDPTSAMVAATVTYDAGSQTATLTPNTVLASSTTYTATVKSGASGVKDLAGNALAVNFNLSFTTGAGLCAGQPCVIWPSSPTPGTPSESDPNAVEVGVKFRSDIAGQITGIRFYKGSTNAGTHIGSLWSSSGQLLARATFSNETASGWQQVDFASPVAIAANTVYVASYHTDVGNYAVDGGYFAAAGVDSPPLRALRDGESGGNGVYAYSATPAFPTSTFGSSNYWVDVVFSTSVAPDTTPPTVTSMLPSDGATGVGTGTAVNAVFSEAMDPATITESTIELRDSVNALVTATVTYNAGNLTATLTPDFALLSSASYTATVIGGVGGVADQAGNALTADETWSFTTGTAANAIVNENALTGNPPSEWDISGSGDPNIQGFATDISVDRGETVSFKIDTDASDYRLDVYRMGYYGGDGARKVATVFPSAALPQNQPGCLFEPNTGLIDCGNWEVSASWSVPANATSGIYFAKAIRNDTGGASHIFFIVRDDSSNSDILFQTADTTWQAYNQYGGNSLYVGGPGTNPGRAYKVSYNRPFTTRSDVTEGQDWVMYGEYPMVRWLERNGYDVTYTTGVDTHRRGNLILNHKLFLSVGHDEYWSAQQRTSVEAARDAGVHLAFFSGNAIYWKTRWEPSIDGSATDFRTLVSYKESHNSAKIDPSPLWTGLWRDSRPYAAAADGNNPENSLQGTIFTINETPEVSIEVPYDYAGLRFWRDTSVEDLQLGQTATLGELVIGYEFDEDLDNGSRPAGLIRLTETFYPNAPRIQDETGSNYAPEDVTHHATLYRAPSSALVFGAGTVQWQWGLDGNHDGSSTTEDPDMQQATVNLFADMGVQPQTVQSELVQAVGSTDTLAPVAAITSPLSGATVQIGVQSTISGTATDSGGGVVGAVEVSVDGGVSWHPATGRGSWTYQWTPNSLGPVTIFARAVDDSGNLEATGDAVGVTVTN